MVAHTPGHHANILGLSCRAALDARRRFTEGGVIVARAHRLDLAAVKPTPQKLLCGKRHFAVIRAHEHIAVLAAFFDDLHQTHRVPEGVKIHRGFGKDAKLFQEIAPPLQDLTHKALARGHVAIGLQIPAAHDMPFSALYQLTDPCKKRRSVFLHVLVNGHLIVAKNIVKFLGQLHRRLKGRKRGTHALGPIPLPNGVNMCIADQMDLFHLPFSF